MNRVARKRLLLLLVLVVPLVTASTGGAEIAPPWCGTPMPDAAAALPDGSSPSHPRGSFPHIPYYAVGCTLESIAEQSNGRMTVEVIGESALGHDLYEVVINAQHTRDQREAYRNWRDLRKVAMDRPDRAQRSLARMGGDVKVPLFIQGGIHGNEYEGVDAAMQVIERLATTPYGSDSEVDRILDHAILIFNPVQNPDGRIAGTRANGNGFDLNRDFLTQAQPETKHSVAIMQRWLPPEMLDLHGYVTPTLIEATTKPHNPSIEYDLWLKWNQARIDANEAALNAEGFQVTRPINDWCADSSIPDPVTGECDDGSTEFGPAVAQGWDDWGPFYTPMYAQHVGLNGSTVEMCQSLSTVPGSSPTRTNCGPLLEDNARVGRAGARRTQYLTVWSTLLYDVANRVEFMHDHFEIYKRAVSDAPRPACCPPPFDVANNWMHDYPKAYVIPFGGDQRSDPDANRLVEWLLFNGAEVEELKRDYRFGAQTFEKDSYVVWMTQARRGLIDTALGIGQEISTQIDILYAPPASWSHGYLWGADVVTIPDSAVFRPKTDEIRRPHRLEGGIASARGGDDDDDDRKRGRAAAYALEVDSPAAVRTLNALLGSGISAELATAPFAGMPAGTVIFPASAARRLDDAGEDAGVWFHPIEGPLPAREPIDRSPRIAVFNASGAVDQSAWSLRNLGFTADPISTANLNSAATDPLAAYDVLFTAGVTFNLGGGMMAFYPPDTPANATARSRLAAFFARGGGFLSANAGGANFLRDGGQLSGLNAIAQSGGGAGYSGIISWTNSGGAASPIVGAYRSQDTAIVDPPTWFSSVPATMTVDGHLPETGFFLSGLWGLATRPGAGGSALIAHGTNTTGTARLATFAMNPLYRADPEREWPMLASAAYWVDQ
jgi:hypothetical protein